MGFNIDYVCQNYLDYNSDQKFDLITMIYCDFCALNPTQRKSLLQIFHQHLKPGGRLLLDVFTLEAYLLREEIINYEHDLLDGFWSGNPHYSFMNTIKYDKEKVVLDKYTIIEETKTWEVYNWLQYFSQKTLKAEFVENDFKVDKIYGSVTGDSLKPDSETMAVVIAKV